MYETYLAAEWRQNFDHIAVVSSREFFEENCDS